MSLGTIKDYTPNFNLIIPEFNISGWHDYLEENFRSIDALFYNLFGINNYSGIWKKLTSYTAGQVVFIGDDTNYSGRLVKILVNHTTTNDDFTTFFTNNPTYYELFADASTAQYYAIQAKDWAIKMDGPVEGSNYSAKYYADMINNLSTEITALYNIASEIQTVANISTDVENVADNETNINTVSSNISDISTVSSNITKINNVNDDLTNINTVLNNISAVNTTATNATNITTVANNVTDINTVASISNDVTSVAGNVTNINTAANNIAAIIDAPNQAASAAASAEAAAQSAEISNPPPLLTHIWSDHLFNDVRYLRADTFSWQDGTVYTNAYDHLVDDVTNGTSQTETIAGHTITYTLADDGHKIVSDTYASEVEGLYNDTGVAWYYILDLVNHRFKLPRENHEREILEQSAPVVGTGKTLGFTNGTDNAGLVSDKANYNHNMFRKTAIDKNVSTSSSGTSEGPIDGLIGVTTDPTKSGIITDLSRKTGIYKGKLYLYFYIGQFSQSATEQTAGLNTELFNNKLDRDMSNINTSQTTKETIVGWSIPDYNAGISRTSGTQYTADTNGYIMAQCFQNASSGSTYITCIINGVTIPFTPTATDYGRSQIYLPIKKGDIYTITANSEIYFFPNRG